MNQKAERPTLSGQRLKTRKRDEKEKYDPNAFRDSIIALLGECEGDLQEVSKKLDKESTKLNYRRYGEVLFDLLIAGGILAPGGCIVESTDPEKPSRTDICLFKWDGDLESLRNFYSVFNLLIRRLKFLEKAFEEDLKKILLFQKGFSPEEREKLAKMTGLILAEGKLCTPAILQSLFQDHLVKEGISVEFAAVMFTTWLEEKDINSVCSALKKHQIDTRLMEIFPQNKRTIEHFNKFFKERGLEKIADMQTAHLATKAKKEAQKRLAEMIKQEETIDEMKEFITELVERDGMTEQEVTISLWNSVMAAVEWNKKEDLLQSQVITHLKEYCPLLKFAAPNARSQLILLIKVQEYCYENQSFLKSFQKIVMLLYKTDVVEEEAIIKWYKDGHSSKGKSVFLAQMEQMIEWLKNAEEESSEEEEDED